MNKKGFTLVELLAVIAILAILVIIALPNVMGMFNTAKENSFKTEVKEIFKTAEQQWMTDSMYSTNDKVYVRTKTQNCGKSLDLSGRTDLEYYIKLDKSGNVVEYFATDGTFQYSFNDTTGLKVENINDVQKIADINSNQKVSISCNGAQGGSNSSVPKYNVGYLMYYNMLCTDSELEEYEQIADTECKIYYIAGTKYNNCKNLLYKDRTQYPEGSQVNLKAMNYKYVNYYELTSCVEQADGSSLCPDSVPIRNATLGQWVYDAAWTGYGYTYEDTDKEVLNFSNYTFDEWDNGDHYFGVSLPQSFTMPGHNILFAMDGKPWAHGE